MRVSRDADDLDFVTDVDDATLDTTGCDRAATGDGEDVFDGHQERLVDGALRQRDAAVDGVEELVDLADPRLVALERLERRTLDDRGVVARELVLVEQLADFHLDELDELLIVDHVALVQEDDDVGHANLTGEKDVLAGLGHRAVGGGDDEDRAVHLRCTGDHVLDVVRVTRAVDVSVVAGVGLVLDVRDGDRDTALALFRSLVDLIERREVGEAFRGLALGDSGRKGGLTVVDVADRTDVDVWLGALELLLRHESPPSGTSATEPVPCWRLRPRSVSRKPALLLGGWIPILSLQRRRAGDA